MIRSDQLHRSNQFIRSAPYWDGIVDFDQHAGAPDVWVLGQVARVVDRREAAVPQVVVNDSPSPVALRAVSTTMSDDEFLGQVEMAIGSHGPAALRPLDASMFATWLAICSSNTHRARPAFSFSVPPFTVVSPR